MELLDQLVKLKLMDSQAFILDNGIRLNHMGVGSLFISTTELSTRGNLIRGNGMGKLLKHILMANATTATLTKDF